MMWEQSGSIARNAACAHAYLELLDKNQEPEEPIDLRHYIAIGKINEALSQHANEAYSELDNKDKEICEVLFKALH
jgi:hypothetical protein